MTSMSDCVLNCNEAKLRRLEVAIQLKGKLHTNYLARKEINETKFTTMNTEKIHNAYKTVATIMQQFFNPWRYKFRLTMDKPTLAEDGENLF